MQKPSLLIWKGSSMALQFEARKVALKQDRTGYVLTLSLHPDEIPVELLRDFVGARYACALVRIQDDESPTAYSNRVQTAGMLCRAVEFQEFLGAIDESSAAAELCKRCGITSRSELNGNEEAQMQFDALVLEYKTGVNNDLF
jgi:hypothetical protein